MKFVIHAKIWIERLVSFIAAISLIWLVLISLLQVILRWVWNAHEPWIDIQAQQFVLLIGLFGAVLASVQQKHIKIDVIEHYFPSSVNTIVKRFISFIGFLILTTLTWWGIKFVEFEKEFGSELKNFFFGISIEGWKVQFMIPVCFFLMALVSLINTFLVTKTEPIESKRLI